MSEYTERLVLWRNAYCQTIARTMRNTDHAYKVGNMNQVVSSTEATHIAGETADRALKEFDTRFHPELVTKPKEASVQKDVARFEVDLLLSHINRVIDAGTSGDVNKRMKDLVRLAIQDFRNEEEP